MKAIKWMLFGLALILSGIAFSLTAVLAGGEGLAFLGILCPIFGLIVCVLGLSIKE